MPAKGHNSKVQLDQEVTLGVDIDAEVIGVPLDNADGQITTATTTTLVTASAGKVLLVFRVAYSVNTDQSNANGAFQILVVDGADANQVLSRIWNPSTSLEYGFNLTGNYKKTGTAKTLKLITPTGFASKLDWVALYKEVDA